MSRLAKKPIQIPAGVEARVDGATVTVSGPKGVLNRVFRDDISFELLPNTITLSLNRKTLTSRTLLGTYAAHIKNMVTGVSKGFEKKLTIEGTGYRAKVQGSSIILSLGYSHDVTMNIPEGLTVAVKENEMTINGADREKVGQFAAVVRTKRPPEPYKGKGIRYSDEVIQRKQGKKAVT